MNDKNVKKQLLKFIFKIGIDLESLSFILNHPRYEIKKWFVQPDNIELNKALICQLASYFEIPEDSIINETYNHHTIRSLYFGKQQPSATPNKYSEHSHSFTRTSVHILKYLSLTRGQHFSDDVIRDFDIPPSYFDSLDNKINFLFFIELLDKMKKVLTKKEYDQLGALLFLGIKNSELGKEFASQNSYYSCYKTLIQNLSMFDNNFIYKTELTPNKLVFKASLNKENIEPLNINPERLINITRYRKTLLEWVPYLSQLSPLTGKINSCITQGDAFTEYEFELPQSKSLFLL